MSGAGQSGAGPVDAALPWQGESLTDLLETRLRDGSVVLPVFDGVAREVMTLVEDGRASAARLCAVLERDPAVAAEVLRVANSSFFGGLGKVSRLRDAVVRLGDRTISGIALAAAQRRLYSASSPRFARRLHLVWRHVSAVALGARWLGERSGSPSLAEQAFVAGLLHDVGKLVVLRTLEEVPASGCLPFELSESLVDQAVQALHAEHGRVLVEGWGLDPELARVAGGHHEEVVEPGDALLAIVRLADLACVQAGIGPRHDPALDLQALPEAELLALDDIQVAELQVVLEDAARELP